MRIKGWIKGRFKLLTAVLTLAWAQIAAAPRAPPSLDGILAAAHLEHLSDKLKDQSPTSLRAIMVTSSKSALLTKLKTLGVTSSDDRKTLLSALIQHSKQHDAKKPPVGNSSGTALLPPSNETLAGFLSNAGLQHLEGRLGASTPASMRALIATAGQSAFLASIKALGIHSSTDRKAMLSRLLAHKRSAPARPVGAPPTPSQRAFSERPIPTTAPPPFPPPPPAPAMPPPPPLWPQANRVAVCISGEQRSATCPPRDARTLGGMSPLTVCERPS